MRLRGIYSVLLAVAVFATAGEAVAQKFPERRTARQGTRLYEKGDYAGAETAYRRALEMNPELREATFNLGNALWRGEKAQEAAEGWLSIANDSLAPPPLISAASYNVGNVSLAGQQIDAAIEAYKQSLRLDPGDMQAKFNLAYAQKLKQQQEQNEDQNQDKNQDQNDQGGGGQDNQDQNQDDRDQDGDQNNPNNQNDRNGDGENDPRDGDNGNNGNDPPPPSGEGQGDGEPKIDPGTAQQMLDAMQAAEDDTREKVNAKEVQAGARSGKNW